MLAWTTYNQINGGRKNALVNIISETKEMHGHRIVMIMRATILSSPCKTDIGKTKRISSITNYNNIRLLN